MAKTKSITGGNSTTGIESDPADRISRGDGSTASVSIGQHPALSRAAAAGSGAIGAPRYALGITDASSRWHGDMKTARAFGQPAIVYSSPNADVSKPDNPRALAEPGSDAMALVAKFCGFKVGLVSSTASPHKLENIPPSIVDIDHSTDMSQRDGSRSFFLLNMDDAELKDNVDRVPRHADVVVSNPSMETVVKHVALLARMRPDLASYGHASSTPDPVNQKGAIEAFRRVGAILGGGNAVVVHALNEKDRQWVMKKTGVDMPAGSAIHAAFNRLGKLDRPSFLAELNALTPPLSNAGIDVVNDVGIERKGESNRESFIRNIESFRELNASLGLSEVAAGKAGRSALHDFRQIVRPSVPHRSDPLKKLGKVLILGSTGNVGAGILRALSGRTPVDAPVRDSADAKDVGFLGNAKYPVRRLPLNVYGTNNEDFMADTVFIAASAPRDPSITDRAAQFEKNLEEVVIPLLTKIPSGVKLVTVITNPCADMSYAAWLLRPDLAGKIASHSGTDIVRQGTRVPEAANPDTYFTFGPHSPNQVNVDLKNNCIDPAVANMASDINERSGGQATTDPTALSSIFEATNILANRQSSYAFPLTQHEARKLQEFLNESGNEALANIEVHEGTAPTLPRKDGRIHWALLDKARTVPGFLDGVAPAIDELNRGRAAVLAHIAGRLAPPAKGSTLSDAERVLLNRDGLLGNLPAQSPRR